MPGWGEVWRRNLADLNGPGNEGAVRGRHRGTDLGCEEEVQQTTFIMLMIITVLTGTDHKKGPSSVNREAQERRNNGHSYLLSIWPSANLTQTAKIMAA
jgi:hypothetical protein